MGRTVMKSARNALTLYWRLVVDTYQLTSNVISDRGGVILVAGGAPHVKGVSNLVECHLPRASSRR